jgi:uncharacterized coiled-coil protein SlyX
MLGEIMNQEDLVFRLRRQAEIRRQIDHISDILEEAANEIDSLRKKLSHFYDSMDDGK